MTGAMGIGKTVGMIRSLFYILITIFLVGCKADEKTYTIGILSRSSEDAQLFVAFMEGMAKRGYIENKDIRYVFHQPPEIDDENIDAGIEGLLSKEIDLLLTTGNKVALRAKQLVKGTDMPVVFSSNPWPVENGIVESMRRPGGNLTGVRFPDTTPKLLEMLQLIDPGLRKIVIPYSPEDKVSVDHFPGLNQAAQQLGIELVYQEVNTVKEAVTAIGEAPEDVGAVLMITAPTFLAGFIEISQSAIKRGILSGSVIPDDAVLLSFLPDIFNAGEKTAHIVHQILLGNKPGNLPVETSEVIFSVNIRTAEQIGVAIPNVVLAQAARIIR